MRLAFIHTVFPKRVYSRLSWNVLRGPISVADNLCSFKQYVLKAVMAHAFHPTAEAEAEEGRQICVVEPS